MIARQFLPLLYALQLLKFQYFQIGYLPDEVDTAMAQVEARHIHSAPQGSWSAFDS
jgi:hypothetical protein